MYDFSDYIDRQIDYDTMEEMGFETLEDYYDFLHHIRTNTEEIWLQ